MNTASRPSEEITNAATHGLGAVLAIGGTVALIVHAASSSDPWRIVSFTVFGATMILLYAASAVYHAMPPGRAKTTFKMIDHLAIFVLIAGTYTPFTLVPLRGPVGWTVFGVIWGMAVAGIVLKIFTIGKYRKLSTLVYIVMGWTVIGAVRPLVQSVPRETLVWLAAGGLSYTFGTVFYLSKRLPYAHAVWHLFVLGGTVSHFIAVMRL